MKTLYLDNYKGFVNTFIPFKDVNFLVGENSTGKTTILNLLNILSNPSFWLSPEFNNETVELGYFNEIVNQCSSNKKYFVIGIEFREKKVKDSPKYFWMKFKNKNSLPYIAEYMTIIAGKSVMVTLHQSCVDFQTIDYNSEDFADWVYNYTKFKGQKKRVSMTQFSKIPPLGILRNIVEMEIKGNTENRLVKGIVITPVFSEFLWFAPIRAKAQRVYESFKQSFSPEGEHTPNILKNIMSGKNKKNDNIVNALIKFGKESALFDNIQIDEYGKVKGAPYAINILYDSLPVKITNVGYGVSQVMPLIVEIITSKDSVFAIQQPEVHLHPKAQAAFGEFIFNSAIENKNKFIVETHSDYTINRFRYKMFQTKENNKISGQVLFFERKNNRTNATSIVFSENGQYPAEMPETYGKFFIDEELKMLEI
ncbi:MAG: AAA family ATPase [Erysipelotrichales bacterium]|nr:AAA family ATPase [Erysipelotrichales bacterium]